MDMDRAIELIGTASDEPVMVAFLKGAGVRKMPGPLSLQPQQPSWMGRRDPPIFLRCSGRERGLRAQNDLSQKGDVLQSRN